jgi:hypothetical protein
VTSPGDALARFPPASVTLEKDGSERSARPAKRISKAARNYSSSSVTQRLIFGPYSPYSPSSPLWLKITSATQRSWSVHGPGDFSNGFFISQFDHWSNLTGASPTHLKFFMSSRRPPAMRLAAFTLAAGINSLRAFPMSQQFPGETAPWQSCWRQPARHLHAHVDLYAWHLPSMYIC